MRDKMIREFSRLGRVVENAPMAGYTTFKTGGDAEVLIRPRDAEAAAAVFRMVRDE